MNRMRKLLGKKILLAVVLAVFTGGLVRAQEVKDTLTLTLDKALEIALSENPTMRVADQEIQLKKEAKKLMEDYFRKWHCQEATRVP